MIVSLTQPLCWCGFWKFRKLSLELLMFSCNIPGHCFYWSPKEVAVSWLSLKPLLFAVETWAYFSTSFFLRCARWTTPSFHWKLWLKAPSLGEWSSASFIIHFHSNFVAFFFGQLNLLLPDCFSLVEQSFSILFLKILVPQILWKKKKKRMMW